jgi:hypothetical protein
MKVDFSQVLKDFRTGEVMTWQSGTVNGEVKPMTLGFCCSESLLLPDGMEKDPAKKVADLSLAAKVFAGGELDITAEEAVRLKSRLAAAYPSAIVAGQCCKMLDG